MATKKRISRKTGKKSASSKSAKGRNSSKAMKPSHAKKAKARSRALSGGSKPRASARRHVRSRSVSSSRSSHQMTRGRFLKTAGIAGAGVGAAAVGFGGISHAKPGSIEVHPGDDIQAIIDSAHEGDTLLFAPGEYHVGPSPIIIDKSLTLMGKGNPKPRITGTAYISDDYGEAEVLIRVEGDATLNIRNLKLDHDTFPFPFPPYDGSVPNIPLVKWNIFASFEPDPNFPRGYQAAVLGINDSNVIIQNCEILSSGVMAVQFLNNGDNAVKNSTLKAVSECVGFTHSTEELGFPILKSVTVMNCDMEVTGLDDPSSYFVPFENELLPDFLLSWGLLPSWDGKSNVLRSGGGDEGPILNTTDEHTVISIKNNKMKGNVGMEMFGNKGKLFFTNNHIECDGFTFHGSSQALLYSTYGDAASLLFSGNTVHMKTPPLDPGVPFVRLGIMLGFTFPGGFFYFPCDNAKVMNNKFISSDSGQYEGIVHCGLLYLDDPSNPGNYPLVFSCSNNSVSNSDYSDATFSPDPRYNGAVYVLGAKSSGNTIMDMRGNPSIIDYNGNNKLIGDFDDLLA